MADFEFNTQTQAITKYIGSGGNVSIPDIIYGVTVKTIGNNAFQNSSITSIIIPEGVTSISYQAFQDCKSLTSITLPQSLTSILDQAFKNCTSLVSITIPKNVTKAGIYGWFEGCTSLKTVTFENGATIIPQLALANSSITSIVIPEGVTSISYQAFQDCKSLTSITLPQSLTSILDQAFKNCTSLVSITIPKNVTKAGIYGWFEGCSSLTSVTIADGATTIPAYAFSSTPKINYIVIPSTIISIGSSAFANCMNLSTALFKGNAPASFGTSVFDNTATDFTIIYNPNMIGWSTPIWKGYRAIPSGSESIPNTNVLLSNGVWVKLLKDPRLGDRSVDTDGDGLPDLDELTTIAPKSLNHAMGIDNSIDIWFYKSRPDLVDSDGDGLDDPVDPEPLVPNMIRNSGKLAWPSISGEVTLWFGAVDNVFNSIHNGIDIQDKIGANVYSVSNGMVTFIGADDYNGCSVLYVDFILDGLYMQARYYHLSKMPAFKIGTTIKKGDIVGSMGTFATETGLSKGLLELQLLRSTNNKVCFAPESQTEIIDPCIYMVRPVYDNSYLQFPMVYSMITGSTSPVMNARFMGNLDVINKEIYLWKAAYDFVQNLQPKITYQQFNDAGYLTFDNSTNTASFKYGNMEPLKFGVSLGNTIKNDRLVVPVGYVKTVSPSSLTVYSSINRQNTVYINGFEISNVTLTGIRGSLIDMITMFGGYYYQYQAPNSGLYTFSAFVSSGDQFVQYIITSNAGLDVHTSSGIYSLGYDYEMKERQDSKWTGEQNIPFDILVDINHFCNVMNKIGIHTEKKTYTKSREIIIPSVINGIINGNSVTKYPTTDWGAPGQGTYESGVQKEPDGRYKIAVGPKIIDPNYPDTGKIWIDDFESYSTTIDLVLENNTTGLRCFLECVVSDYKAHSYNKYPDGQPYNTGDIASYNVENGILQTGIAYPQSWNAERDLAFSVKHSTGIVIEFAGSAVDFNIDDYKLIKIIVVE